MCIRDRAYCERLYEAAREAEADIACASMLKIRPSYSKWTIHYTEQQVAAEAQEKFRLCRCPPDFYVMNKLLRREMLLRLGLRFRERVCYEDEMCIRDSYPPAGQEDALNTIMEQCKKWNENN